MKAVRPLVATAAVLAVLAAVVLLSRHRQPPPAPPPPAGATPAPTPVPGILVLFFPADDTLLHREARQVPEVPAALGARIRLVVEELIAGSREGYAPAVPWAATVDAVFVDHEGNAYVDLSTPPDGAIEGSDGELAFAFAAVDSVVTNCPGVRRVQLLLGGHEVATLGHLDLSRPLPPDLEIVAP
jgi:Sporulation and spore germination